MEDVARPARASASFASTWLPVVLYAALIVVVSSIPAQRLPSAEGLWKRDKLIHCAEFALLGGLLARALVRGTRLTLLAAVVLAASLAAAWGILDELHQWYVPGRSSDPYDALADIVGGILGATLLGRLSWRSSVRSAA